MEALRTPDERFAGLPDFPFAPHYVEVADGDGGTLRVHYLDEGPADGAGRAVHARRAVVVLPLPQDDPGPRRRRASAASRPTSSASAAPTSRPSAPTTRTRATSSGCAPRCSTRSTCATSRSSCQDWGGLIGLRLVGEHPDRFARVVAANTFLPTGDTPPGEAFLDWQHFSQTVEDFDVGFIVGMRLRDRARRRRDRRRTTRRSPTTPTRPARASSRCSCRPRPTIPASAANRKAWETLRAFDKPFLTAFSDKDPITRGGDRAFQREVPGCAGQPHTTIEGGGHFLQEDRGEELARVVVELDRRQVASARIDVIALLDEVRAIAQTGLHYATDPFDRDRYEQLLALRRAGVRRPRRPRRRRGARPLRQGPRLRDGQGRRRRRDVRRARPHPARAPRRRRQVGPDRGLGRRQRDAGADRRARGRRGGRPRRAASTSSSACSAARAGVARQPAQRRVDRVPLRRDRRRAPRRNRTRCARSRGARSTTSTDWHHHHETLAARRARSALAAHGRRLTTALRAAELNLAEAVCLTLVAREPRHGWSIVKALAPDGEIGRVWSLSRPLTYRALDALADVGADRAPRLRAGWRPAAHDLARDREGPARVAAPGCAARFATRRDMRTEFLLKVELGAPAAELARAQLDGVRAGVRRTATVGRRRSRRRRRPLARSNRPRRPAASCVARLVCQLR